jgi:hypothetical protein
VWFFSLGQLHGVAARCLFLRRSCRCLVVVLGVFVDPVVWSLAPLCLIFSWLGYSFAPHVLVSLAGNPSFPLLCCWFRCNRCNPCRLMALLIQSRALRAFRFKKRAIDSKVKISQCIHLCILNHLILSSI